MILKNSERTELIQRSHIKYVPLDDDSNSNLKAGELVHVPFLSCAQWSLYCYEKLYNN